MKQAMQMGLWSIWLSGVILIGLSLYATKKLPSLKYNINKVKFSPKGFNNLPGNPKITILTAPSPFDGAVGDMQSLAIQSWLDLSPQISVVLFSQHPSVASFADGFGSRVLVDTDIDFTFIGTPFFHSMVASTRHFKADIYALLHPATILLADFISTLNFAYRLDHDWFLFASSRNISRTSFDFGNKGKSWFSKKLQEILKENWQLDYCGERMLIAGNRGSLPLHTGVLPPFIYGKGIHNEWLVNEAALSEFRLVFDASLTISNFYLNGFKNLSNQLIEDFKSRTENRSWEYASNAYLGARYGLFYFRQANFSSLVILLKCDGQHHFVDTKENIVYPIRYQNGLSLWKGRTLKFWRDKRYKACISVIQSLDRRLPRSSKGQLKPSITLDLPFSLESLLSVIADNNKTVVLTVAGYSYKDMLMSWVCRLRHLLIKNFIVCALDEETYRFAVMQGLPVFKVQDAPSDISYDDCHFGTTCFQRVTKVKSRIVLEILKLGYNVLLSDTDVYWFQNPLPVLQSFGPSILAAQSDEFDLTGPINLPRRLNSGFYFAHSDSSTIAAMEKVVKHAATSQLSEQPSFYDTLCGEGGSNRVGNNKCVEPETNLTVYFLDRDQFPNGAYQDLWQKRNVKEACAKKGCLIIHNNWINGRRKKLERQVHSGLWDYDISMRMCKWRGHKVKLTRDV